MFPKGEEGPECLPDGSPPRDELDVDIKLEPQDSQAGGLLGAAAGGPAPAPLLDPADPPAAKR
eukprot:gene4459-7389_t